MIARRDRKRVEKDFKNKLDDIVVECFDKEYQIQPKIKKTDDIETKGRKGVYHARSFEKIEQWRRTVEKMYRRRLYKNRKKDDDYIEIEREDSSDLIGYSRESIEFKNSMDEAKRLHDSVELKFATNFEDMKEMSTMVALTAGAKAVDVGINKVFCAQDISRSISQEQKLREPQRRQKLFSDYEIGKVTKHFVERRPTQAWISSDLSPEKDA